MLWFGYLKTVFLNTAPMSAHLYCALGPSNYPAPAILYHDVTRYYIAQAPAKIVQKFATKKVRCCNIYLQARIFK